MDGVSAKDKQNDCRNNTQIKNTIEKNKLEDVNQSLYNLDANSTNRKDYNFIKLCKKTAKRDDETMKKWNDVVVEGLNLFRFYFNLIFPNKMFCSFLL